MQRMLPGDPKRFWSSEFLEDIFFSNPLVLFGVLLTVDGSEIPNNHLGCFYKTWYIYIYKPQLVISRISELSTVALQFSWGDLSPSCSENQPLLFSFASRERPSCFFCFGKERYGCFQKQGTPKSSILMGFSLINHPFWVPLFLETPI